MIAKEKALLIIEKEFENYGFQLLSINDRAFWCLDKCYCVITYLEGYSAFVIESTASRDDAEKGVLEDGELFFINRLSEDELIQKLRVELDFFTNIAKKAPQF